MNSRKECIIIDIRINKIARKVVVIMKKVWKKVISATLCVALLSVFALIPASAQEVEKPSDPTAKSSDYLSCGFLGDRYMMEKQQIYFFPNITTSLTDITRYEIGYFFEFYDYDGVLYNRSGYLPSVDPDYVGSDIVEIQYDNPTLLKVPVPDSTAYTFDVTMRVVVYSKTKGPFVAEAKTTHKLWNY